MLRPLAVAALLLAATGCSGGSDPTPAAPTPTPTPLSAFDTTGLTVARASFCANVAPASVEDALGGPVDSAGEWANGERARLSDDTTDVAHEFGCRWVSADGATVTAWVFAPPVTPDRAESLHRAAVKAEGCRAVRAAPAYGASSVAVRCDDGTTAFHGLFGDAWLSCAIITQPPADLDRTGRWCVTVAQAAQE